MKFLEDKHPSDTIIKISTIDCLLNKYPRQLQLNSISGDFYFLAPETLTKEDMYYQSDLWACGITTYLLIMGEHPFPGRTAKQLMIQIEQGPVNPWGLLQCSTRCKDFMKCIIQ
jgi:serine/threonine protein kinase